MTRAAWAERKVEKICAQPLRLGHGEWPVGQCEAVRLLRAEHKRAVRVVKRLEKAATLDKHSLNNDQFAGYMGALRHVLAALQKGRT